MNISQYDAAVFAQSLPTEDLKLIARQMFRNPGLVELVRRNDPNATIEDYLNSFFNANAPSDGTLEAKDQDFVNGFLTDSFFEDLKTTNVSDFFENIEISESNLELLVQHNGNIVNELSQEAKRMGENFVTAMHFREWSERQVYESISDAIDTYFMAEARVAQQLPEETVERLIHISNHPHHCAICLADSDAVCIKLACTHEFDESCLVTWFKYANTCPLCRSVVE